MPLDLISDKYELSADHACTVVKMATTKRITSNDLAQFQDYLLKNGQICYISEENGGVPVLQAFGSKMRNLGKKTGNGFHIQGCWCSQRKTETWLAMYHFQSFLGNDTQRVIVEDQNTQCCLTLLDQDGSILFS